METSKVIDLNHPSIIFLDFFLNIIRLTSAPPPPTSALEFARRCVQTGKCDIGDMTTSTAAAKRSGKQTDEGELQSTTTTTTTTEAAASRDEPAVVTVDRSTLEQKVRRCLFHGICY